MKNESGKMVLAAAAVLTPSNWSVPEKLGHDVHTVHESVTGYDRLRKTVEGALGSPVKHKIMARNNWLLLTDAALCQSPFRLPAPRDPEVTAKNAGSTLYMRSELETILHLPRSGAVVFTIRPRVWSLDFIRSHSPETMAKIIEGMENDEENYEDSWLEAVLGYNSAATSSGTLTPALP
jgi:hypothetical protein